MTDLITRVRQAKGGDRELDGLVEVAARWHEAAATGIAPEHRAPWESDTQGWVRDPHTIYASEPVSSSVDAAISLVERVRPAFWWVVGGSEGMEYEAEVGRWKAKGHSAPLALLAALLSSLEEG